MRGFCPSGLLPNEEASVTRVLDQERWAKAEERTAELIARIQPNLPSEERRNAVACYVQRLVTNCFSSQVFTFGSVPLKTYLPDGDIDLTTFSENENLKDTWAHKVRDALVSEEKREDAEFRVKEVQYIQAEVKIIKCLVENIVVDISLNQLGGLCTLCFLEEIDRLISQNHLFKRSIILIKAWCYYESRILGAHHGLISTYALETLVLYIFHVFNNSFAGPLEVLYRFLEFFGKFDWDNFCISLWGPVPLSALPDMTADPPRKDGGELLLSKSLETFSSLFAVFPGGQENQDQPFISKHFNVIDPLRTNNNLGRSVSKGNFFRIRSAFAFGAQRLARLLDCPRENVIAEVNLFFMNTWDRHGKGLRPDAVSPDLIGSQPVHLNHSDGFDSLRNDSISKKVKGNIYESDVEVISACFASHAAISQHGNNSLKQVCGGNNGSSASRTKSPVTYSNLTSSMASDQNPKIAQSNNKNTNTDRRRSFRSDYLGNEVHARYQFARTYSSPELTDTSCEVPSQGRNNRALDTVKFQSSSARSDNRRRNFGTEIENHIARSSAERPSSRNCSFQQSTEVADDSKSASNSYRDEAGLGETQEDFPFVVDKMQMCQEEQDIVNMLAPSHVQFNGHVPMPFNVSSGSLPFPVSPSILASLGYPNRNTTGMVPTLIPSLEPSWVTNLHYSQGLVSPVSQYFPSGVMASNQEVVETFDDNLVSTESNQVYNNGFWPRRNAHATRGLDPDDGNFTEGQLYRKQQYTSAGFNIAPSQVSSSDNCSMKDHKIINDNRDLTGESYVNNPLHQKIRGKDSRYIPASHASSSRTKASFEVFGQGSGSKGSKLARERRGRKTVPSANPSIERGLDKNGWQFGGESVGHMSFQEDDSRRSWIPLSTVGTKIAENTVSETVPSHVQTRRMPGYESAQANGSNLMLPIAPMLVSSESQQKAIENHDMLRYAFYPTGPPVPFLTMLPIYNFPGETGTCSASTSHIDEDGEFTKSHGSQSVHSLDSADNRDQRDSSVEPLEKHKSDILNSDFACHWKNLQYGRLCQNAQSHGPSVYPSSVFGPPMYLQGHFPWDGPGRPPASVNLLTQLANHGPQLIPVSPRQPGSNRPAGIYRHYGDEFPRYRGGTGTYLPNPRVSFRDRQSSNMRNHRGNYGHDHKDHHGDREGNWNVNSRPRFASRGQGRSFAQKPSSRPEPSTRIDRNTASNNRSDRQVDSFKHESFPTFRTQNGPFSSSNSMHLGSANGGAYGMYPLPVMNPNGVSPSGSGVPSVVMLLPYSQSMDYSSSSEQLEFGSLGPVHFSGVNEVSELGEDVCLVGNEQGDFQVDSAHSSPDEPSSPNYHRRS